MPLAMFVTCHQGALENKNREIAVLTKQLNTAKDQVIALKSSVTNLTNEKVRLWEILTQIWDKNPSQAAAERANIQKEGQVVD